MSKKAVVAGHICIDITPVFPDGVRKVSDLGELLKPGKLIQVGAPDVHTGGAVANTGLGMKRLGADVKLLGKIGDDSFGSMIRNVLDQYGAGSDLLVTEGETSSYSVVILCCTTYDAISAIPSLDEIRKMISNQIIIV